MVQPGLIVHSGRELNEQREVLSAKVELSVLATEVEALVLAQLARSVLAHVAAMLRSGRESPNPHRLARFRAATPQERLARSRRGGKSGGGVLADRLAGRAEGLVRRSARGNRHRDRPEPGRP